MGFDPRAQWDSPITSLFDPVGFDPRAQWDPRDSARGAEPFDRESGPIRLLNRRSNRLFGRPFDHASHRPVEPRCADHTTPRIEPPIEPRIGAMRAKASSSAFGRAPLAPFRPNFGPRWKGSAFGRALPLGGLLLETELWPALARTPRYWFARAPRARYWLMRAVREWPCTRGG